MELEGDFEIVGLSTFPIRERIDSSREARQRAKLCLFFANEKKNLLKNCQRREKRPPVTPKTVRGKGELISNSQIPFGLNAISKAKWRKPLKTLSR